MLTRFFMNVYILFVCWENSNQFYMAIVCWCPKKSLTNMGFPCCCEFAFVLHGIPMLRAFRLLFLMFTWETHIKGHKKKPPTWKNYVNFEI